MLARFYILLIFVDETAAQTSAHACDLVRSERDTLFLRHLDRDRREIGKELGTATRFETASAHAADDLRDVARTDLPHLDKGVWIQVVHVLFEGLKINLFLALRAKQKREAGPVVVVFRCDDLNLI